MFEGRGHIYFQQVIGIAMGTISKGYPESTNENTRIQLAKDKRQTDKQ
jgi:hypothetical protein